MRRLEDRVALVTGGGTGIGRATAIRLSAEGAKVAVAGRRREPLEETVAAFEGPGIAVVADVANEADAARTVDETVAAFGRLDILVNNAGSIRRGQLLHETPVERWDELVSANLRSVFL